MELAPCPTTGEIVAFKMATFKGPLPELAGARVGAVLRIEHLHVKWSSKFGTSATVHKPTKMILVGLCTVAEVPNLAVGEQRTTNNVGDVRRSLRARR